jgi:hypothetical protein
MTPARCNLREVSFSHLFPLEVARGLSGGLAMAVAYIHSRGFVHGDIHLRNVLVKLPSSFDQFSIEELYKEYGEPETVAITERSKQQLPATAVLPLYPTRISFLMTLKRHSHQGTQTDWDKTAIRPWPCNLQKLDSHDSLPSPIQRISGA